MREILFRGKMTYGGEWSYGNLKVSLKGTAIITPDETVLGKYGQVDPETVGQYTGVDDNDGNKIFEGDIVTFRRTNALGYVNERIGEVRYFDKLPIFYIYSSTGDAWDWTECEDIKVIGNRFDNPEILQEASNICGSTNLKCIKCNPGACENRKAVHK